MGLRHGNTGGNKFTIGTQDKPSCNFAEEPILKLQGSYLQMSLGSGGFENAIFRPAFRPNVEKQTLADTGY